MAALPLARQHARERGAPDADSTSDRLSAPRTAWTEMTNNRSFAVRRRCLEIAVISILDNQRTHSRSPLCWCMQHGSRGAMPPRRPRALRLRRWRAASAPRRRRRPRAARSGPCRPRRPPPPPPPARPRVVAVANVSVGERRAAPRFLLRPHIASHNTAVSTRAQGAHRKRKHEADYTLLASTSAGSR